MSVIRNKPTIGKDGWTLVSGEKRHAENPETFQIPQRRERESLVPGDGAKLLFDIETKENGIVIDRGVDRMWVIVKQCTESGYIGILENDPGTAENLSLNEGDLLVFGPEHIIEIDSPPREYILKKYGSSFFEN